MERKDDRRRSRRFDLSWPIEVGAGREVARGQTANISRGGAFFHSPSRASLKAGMTVDVRISVPGEAGKTDKPRIIEGRARVVRLEETPGGCDVALHFSEELDALPGADKPDA